MLPVEDMVARIVWEKVLTLPNTRPLVTMSNS